MAGTTFSWINLISEGSVLAAQTDSNLINPWGVSFSPKAAKPLLRAFLLPRAFSRNRAVRDPTCWGSARQPRMDGRGPEFRRRTAVVNCRPDCGLGHASAGQQNFNQ